MTRPPRRPVRRSVNPDAFQIVQGLRRIVKALHVYSQEVHQSFGLTGPQLWALKTLQREGPMPAGQLAEALAVHQSSLSILVDRLERRGLVRRVRSTPDRRVVRIALTRAGSALSGRAPEAAQGRLLHGLRAMSAQRVRGIRQAIDSLVTAMEAGGTTARFFFSDT